MEKEIRRHCRQEGLTVGRDNEVFLEALKKSHKAVFKIAEWVHRGSANVRSRTVIIPASNGEQPDACDLMVWDEDQSKVMKLEIKHKVDTKFTSVDDYPFKTIIVSNSKTIERNWGKIEAYIIVNDKLTHAAIIPFNTNEKWKKFQIYAKNTDKVEEFYVCPKECATFVRILE